MPGAGDAPLYRPALRRARGPDLSGAVLLPSPRRTKPQTRSARIAGTALVPQYCAAAACKHAARRRAEEHGKNATPHETPDYRCDCPDDSCCGTPRARCLDGCATSRHARPLQTAWPGLRPGGCTIAKKFFRGGSLPRTPPGSGSSELQRPEQAEINAKKQGKNATPHETPDHRGDRPEEARSGTPRARGHDG